MSKDKFIKIRATSAEKQAWSEMVLAEGKSLSEVMRDYLNMRLRRVNRAPVADRVAKEPAPSVAAE